MKYNVHIYGVVRAKVVGVEAESQQDAIKKVEDIDLDAVFTRRASEIPCTVACVEFADDVESYLVDEEGDPEHMKTREYDKFGEPKE